MGSKGSSCLGFKSKTKFTAKSYCGVRPSHLETCGSCPPAVACPWDLGSLFSISLYQRNPHRPLDSVTWILRFKVMFYASLIFLYLLISFACELSLLILSHVYTHMLRTYSKKCVIRWLLLSWEQHTAYFTSLSAVSLSPYLASNKLGQREPGMAAAGQPLHTS